MNIISIFHLAFQHTSMPTLISSGDNRNILKVNNAACKLTGYTINGLKKMKWTSLFENINGQLTKMLGKNKKPGQVMGQATIIKKNGKKIICEVTSAIFKDDEGSTYSITTLNDRSASLKLQKDIDTRKDRNVTAMLNLAKSNQRKLDTKNRKIAAGNIALTRQNQKNIDTKNRKKVSDNIDLAISKQKLIDIQNKKVVAENITIALSRQSVIDKLNKKIIADDIENALEKSDRRFNLIFNSSSDVLFEIDLLEDNINLSDAYEDEFGYTLRSHMSPIKDWANHIHKDDRQDFINEYRRILKTRENQWNFNYRFLKSNGEIASVVSSAIILRDTTFQPYRLIGSMQDISKQVVLEERLETEIRLKESQANDAMEEARDAVRSAIGKELHDNVNQLLAVSRMYLDLAKKGGEKSELFLTRSSYYMMEAIEEIRKLSKGLTSDTIKDLGLVTAIDTLIKDTMQISPIKISLNSESFSEESVGENFKLNLYRILQEQFNNILKHSKAKKVTIGIRQTKNVIRLAVTDDGIGYNKLQKRKGIGMDNIIDRSRKFNGEAVFNSTPGKGSSLAVSFNLPK